MKIFIVDDEPDITEILEFYIQDILPGVEIKTFNNPLELLETATKESFNILLTDISMPQMRGDVLIKTLEERKFPLDKVIIVSGFVDANKITSSYNLTTLSKPVSLEEIAKALKS